MNKACNIIGIVIFLLALYAVPLSFFLMKDKEFSENENRYLAQKPQASFDEVISGEYMKDVEKYVDDQFPLRDGWTAFKADILQLAGYREVNGVYLCDDGYLIEKWIDSEFDKEQLKQNIDALNDFCERYPKQRICVMIVPTAGYILSGKLPKGAPVFDQSIAFDMIREGLHSGEYIDVCPVLEEHSAEDVFYRTDHHWTTYGAFLAYSKWCEAMNIHTSQDDFKTETVTSSFRGSIYSMVLGSGCAADEIELYYRINQPDYTVLYNFGRTESDSVYAPDKLDQKDKYQVFLGGNHPEITIKTSLVNDRHLLIIKDSYANAFVPFLINDYESIHIIDLRYYNGDIDSYISENSITECLVLYNIKNFCEDRSIERLK